MENCPWSDLWDTLTLKARELRRGQEKKLRWSDERDGIKSRKVVCPGSHVKKKSVICCWKVKLSLSTVFLDLETHSNPSY